MRVEKTYKRELSVVLLGVLYGFFLFGLWHPVSLEVAKYLAIPTFTAVFSAFGFDALVKQWNK